MSDSIFQIQADGVDVEKLVGDIRRPPTARWRTAPTPTPASPAPSAPTSSTSADEDQFLGFYLECLRDAVFVDISDFEIRERRPLLGPLLVALKKAIWKLLKFYTYRLWSQQNQVNGLIVTAVEGMDEKYAAEDQGPGSSASPNSRTPADRAMQPAPDRIAFVCPRFSESGTVGGAETLLKELAAPGRRTPGARWTSSPPAPTTISPGKTCSARRHAASDGMNVHFFPWTTTATWRRSSASRTPSAARMGLHRADEDTWIRNSVNSRALSTTCASTAPTTTASSPAPTSSASRTSPRRSIPQKTLLVPCLHDEPFAYLGIMRELFDSVAGCLFNTEPERDLARGCST